MLMYTDALLADSSPLLVNTLSFGMSEAVGELLSQNCSSAQMDAIDASLAKLAARGITVLVSSGDHGPQYCAAGVPSAWCPSARDGSPLAADSFWTAWPASSPWVTAVGGATFVGGTVGAEQEAMQSDGGCFTSDGGFSRRFNRSLTAPWQLSAVEAYLNRSAGLLDFPPAAVLAAQGHAPSQT
eukprot:7382385-Prymnesium_polylepis.1